MRCYHKAWFPASTKCPDTNATQGSYRQAAEQSGPGYDPALVQIGTESGGQEILQRLGRLGVDYDGLLLSSINRAIRVVSFVDQRPEQTDTSPLVGAFGSPELAGTLPESVAVCGPSLREQGREIYSILNAEINYAAEKKRVAMVPCVMRRAHAQSAPNNIPG